METKDAMVIENFDSDTALVKGLNPAIEGIVTSLGGVKKGTSWYVPKEAVDKLRVLQSIYLDNTGVLPSNPRSRFTQRKFRREGSDVESSSSESSGPSRSSRSREGSSNDSDSSSGGELCPPPGSKTCKRDIRNRENQPRESLKYKPPGAVDPSVLLVDSSDSSEGSDYGSSSDSDFPEGISPRNHTQEYRAVMVRKKRIDRIEKKRKLNDEK